MTWQILISKNHYTRLLLCLLLHFLLLLLLMKKGRRKKLKQVSEGIACIEKRKNTNINVPYFPSICLWLETCIHWMDISYHIPIASVHKILIDNFFHHFYSSFLFCLFMCGCHSCGTEQENIKNDKKKKINIFHSSENKICMLSNE